MKKNKYVTPQTEVVILRLTDTILGDKLDDLFGGASEEGEDSHTHWATAKEGGMFEDFVPFGNLWDDDPVEDPFKLDE
jgi:hypothetical protein